MAEEFYPNLQKLEELTKQGDLKVNFNARLEPGLTETLETAYDFVLPDSYKQFLSRFNGGMITEFAWPHYVDMHQDDPDGAKWNSFYWFNLDEIQEKYLDMSLDDFLVPEGFAGTYPIIPICISPKQKLLFLLSEKLLSGESPIFATYNVDGDQIAVKVAPDFNQFLGFYLNLDGFPALLPDPEAPYFQTFWKEKVTMPFTVEKSPQENLVKYSALIKLIPENAWNYCMRGAAQRRLGNRELALADFNLAIEMNDKKAFYYYSRGDLILDYGSPRKALIDLDIAVKLEPGDAFYLSMRGNALHELGKYQKALADYNKALEVEKNYGMALMGRRNIYRKLGEKEKAAADTALLEQLQLD